MRKNEYMHSLCDIVHIACTECIQRNTHAPTQRTRSLHIYLRHAQGSFEQRSCTLHLGIGTCACVRKGDADDDCDDRGCPVIRSSAGGSCGVGGRATIFLVVLSLSFPFLLLRPAMFLPSSFPYSFCPRSWGCISCSPPCFSFS